MSEYHSQLKQFQAELKDIPFEQNVLLENLARWKIGGIADLVVSPKSTEQVSTLIEALQRYGLPYFVMGDGSNMLFSDEGFRGVVLRVGQNMSQVEVVDERVFCGAGKWVPCLARTLAQNGLTGLEHIVGIPGTLGGLVVMNGGSQRKGVGAHVRSVTAVSASGEIKTLNQTDLSYSYRQSALQGSGDIVTQVELDLARADASSVRQEMLGILVSRKRKFPKQLPNCGSTFLSNPSMYDVVGPPGKAIEAVGLKGACIGGAQISPMHANFIVNRGGARADEVLALIALIRSRVFDMTGFSMDCEVRHLTPQGEERPAHEYTDAGRFDEALLKQVEYPNV